MKKAILLFALLALGSTAQAQETTITDLTVVTKDQELLIDPTNHQGFILASPQDMWEMAFNGWAPIVEDPMDDALICQWADGVGGQMQCPPGSVGCNVYVNIGLGLAAIACEDAEGNVRSLGLRRPL